MGGDEGKLEERIQDIFDRSQLRLQSLDGRDHHTTKYRSFSNMSLVGSDHQDTKEHTTATLKVSPALPLILLSPHSSVIDDQSQQPWT